jgi:hypothetical protein
MQHEKRLFSVPSFCLRMNCADVHIDSGESIRIEFNSFIVIDINEMYKSIMFKIVLQSKRHDTNR